MKARLPSPGLDSLVSPSQTVPFPPASTMNPMTNIKNVLKMNDRELEMGLAGTSNSWHKEYKVRSGKVLFFY